MSEAISELQAQMVGLRREIEHQKNRVIAYEQRIKELEAPICIGQPIITILAETGEWRSEDGRGVIAASDLFHNNPYDELAVHRATETCSQCQRPWNPSYVESGWCMSCIIKERDEQIEKLKEGTIKPDMFPAALCQKCSCDGDLYHAAINRYPVGTTFRCPDCFTLFTPPTPR